MEITQICSEGWRVPDYYNVRLVMEIKQICSEGWRVPDYYNVRLVMEIKQICSEGWRVPDYYNVRLVMEIKQICSEGWRVPDYYNVRLVMEIKQICSEGWRVPDYYNVRLVMEIKQICSEGWRVPDYYNVRLVMEIKQICHTVWLHWEEMFICVHSFQNHSRVQTLFILEKLSAEDYMYLHFRRWSFLNKKWIRTLPDPSNNQKRIRVVTSTRLTSYQIEIRFLRTRVTFYTNDVSISRSYKVKSRQRW